MVKIWGLRLFGSNQFVMVRSLMLCILFIASTKINAQLPKIDWEISYEELNDFLKDDPTLIVNSRFKHLTVNTTYFDKEVSVTYAFRKNLVRNADPNSLILDSVNIRFLDADGEYDFDTHYGHYLNIRAELIQQIGSNDQKETENVISSIWADDNFEIFHYIEKTDETEWAIHGIEINRVQF